MASFLLFTLTIALLFAGGQSGSQSMSCSTVNGRMVCERQVSDGNLAGAFSSSFSGANGYLQNAAAMTGNTATGNTQASETSLGFGLPNSNPNNYFGRIPGFSSQIGTGASDATSFYSNNGNTGISSSGYAGGSNMHGFPGPAFGGFAAADSTGNGFYRGGNAYGVGFPQGAGNIYGGGYSQGYGYPNGFNPQNVFSAVGLGGVGFPFSMLGRRR